MLRFTHADLKQSRFYQEVFAEGHQEGRQEECVALVLRLIKRRFGRIPAKQSQQNRSLPLANAEILAEALLDFQTVDDLTAWLAAHADPAS